MRLTHVGRLFSSGVKIKNVHTESCLDNNQRNSTNLWQENTLTYRDRWALAEGEESSKRGSFESESLVCLLPQSSSHPLCSSFSCPTVFIVKTLLGHQNPLARQRTSLFRTHAGVPQGATMGPLPIRDLFVCNASNKSHTLFPSGFLYSQMEVKIEDEVWYNPGKKEIESKGRQWDMNHGGEGLV